MSGELLTFIFFVVAILVAYGLGVDVGKVTERAKWNREVVREAADRIADDYRREVA